VPRDTIDIHRSEARDQSERNSWPSPKPVEIPVQAEADAKGYGHGDLFVISQSIDHREEGLEREEVDKEEHQ
jgi:hypothetical protein